MSRVLVLGGTRFVGRLTAMRLAERHDVLVLSRNAADVPGARRLVADRLQGLAQLQRQRFDIVLDFIAYDDAGVAEASANGDVYVAVSSTWLPRLNGGAADAPVPADDTAAPASMPAVTRGYLLGKATLEQAIGSLRASGSAAAAVRLPILMGSGDHTRRLEFYRSRIAAGGPLLLVDGGPNLAQILWSEDAARLLAALIESGRATARHIWEALPDDGCSVADFVRGAARGMSLPVELVDVPSAILARELPSYLDAEPLWRESPLARSSANVFATLGVAPTPREQWLASLPEPTAVTWPDREVELALAGRLASSRH